MSYGQYPPPGGPMGGAPAGAPMQQMQQPMQQMQPMQMHQQQMALPTSGKAALGMFTSTGAPPAAISLIGFALAAAGILVKTLAVLVSVDFLAKLAGVLMAPGLIVISWFCLGTALKEDSLTGGTKVALVFAAVLLIFAGMAAAGGSGML